MFWILNILSAFVFSASPCPNYFDSHQCQIFQDTNTARQANDLKPLKPSPTCTKLAQAHAIDMFQSGKLFHTSPKFGDLGKRLEAFQVPGMSHGENVFWSSQGVKYTPKVVDGWMNSPGHRKNILSSKFTAIGIGVRNGYFAQCFSNE